MILEGICLWYILSIYNLLMTFRQFECSYQEICIWHFSTILNANLAGCLTKNLATLHRTLETICISVIQFYFTIMYFSSLLWINHTYLKHSETKITSLPVYQPQHILWQHLLSQKAWKLKKKVTTSKSENCFDISHNGIKKKKKTCELLHFPLEVYYFHQYLEMLPASSILTWSCYFLHT